MDRGEHGVGQLLRRRRGRGGHRRVARLELVVGALAVLVAVLVGAGLWRTAATFDRNRRLDETPEQITVEVSRARFAADELLAGEADVDPQEDVLSRLDVALGSCRWGIDAALDDASQTALVEVCEGIGNLRVAVAESLEEAAAEGLSEAELDELEERVEPRFAPVMADAEEADEAVEAAIVASNREIVRLDVAVLVLVVALGGASVIIVGRNRRAVERRTDELEVQTSRLEEAQRLAGVGSYELDLATGEVEWSPELYRLFGLDPDGFRPTYDGVRDRVHPDDVAWAVERFAEAIVPGGTWDFEFRILRPDGEVRWVHGNGRVYPESGPPVRVIGTLQDVTDHRHAMDALRRGMEQQRAAADRQRALDEMKQALLSAVSHHVRTPLTSIRGFASILAERDVGQEQGRDLARRVVANAERLEALLTELMDVDRLGREFVEVRRVPADVGALVREEVEAFGGDRPVRVEAQPVEAEVDPDVVRRILRQFLENADRFSPPGTPVQVGVEHTEDGDVLLRVDDEGPGVPEELHASIFEPFRQGAGVQRHSPGLGVGLAVVARLARLHGGRVWVENRVEGGASFRVMLRGRTGDEDGEASERVRRLLEVGRRHLGMDFAFVSRMTADEARFLHVEGEGASFPGIEPGSSLSADETYCRHMLAGRIPCAVPDTSVVPEARELQITKVAGIGAYVGVPVVLGDGTVFGALCCVAKQPAEDVDDRDVAFLRMLGELVALEVDPRASVSMT